MPFVAVVVSILGTLGVMYLLGFSLNNLSLMALTIATGFVVDDAVVVLENIQRHVEQGMNRVQAALLGAREVGFTVLSISVSLIAVFIPLLFMGGIVGRLFREFAMTMSVAVMISLVISLTTTPMIAAHILRSGGEQRAGWIATRIERVSTTGFIASMAAASTGRSTTAAPVLLMLAGAIALNIFLFVVPAEGLLSGTGYRRDVGRHPRRPEHFLCRYAEPS